MPHSKRVLGSNPPASWGPSVWSSPHACVGFLRVLWLPPTVQRVRLIGDSKLPVGVNVSVGGCLSLYVGPVIDYKRVRGVSRPSPLAQCQLGSAPAPHNPVYR